MVPCIHEKAVHSHEHRRCKMVASTTKTMCDGAMARTWFGSRHVIDHSATTYMQRVDHKRRSTLSKSNLPLAS